VSAQSDTDASTRSEALAILTLPAIDRLTERQVRGITCIWDVRHPLHAAIAVDLGVREASRAGAPVTWYPRACRSCVHLAAYATLQTHAVNREECPGDVEACETCRALLRLLRETR